MLEDKTLLIIGGILVLALIFGGYFYITHNVNIVNNYNNVVPQLIIDKIVPKEDAPGEDLKEIPRVQGFVRVSYEHQPADNGDNYWIEYAAKGDRFDEVREFYLNLLRQKGYKLSSETNEQVNMNIPYVKDVKVLKSTMLSFYYPDNSKEVYITIHLGEFKGEKFTRYEIEYDVYYNTENEETSENTYKDLGIEPQIKEIKRYPGSVYYGANTLGSILVDQYYTRDNITKVFNFYKENIPEGYKLEGAGLQTVGDVNAGITYISNDNKFQIIVSLVKVEDGTEIQITKAPYS